MTPKEKAWNIYHKYKILEGKFGDKVMYNYDAKQCALIAVDEILNNDGFTNFDEYLTQYWQEVRQEIRLL